MHTALPRETTAQASASLTWARAQHLYAEHLTEAGAAASSAALHRRNVSAFAAWLPHHPPLSITAADVLAWLGSAEISAATWRSRRASLRHFYRWTITAGLLTENPTAAVPSCRPLVLALPRTRAHKPSGPKRLPVPRAWRTPLTDFDRWLVVNARPATTRTTYRQILEHCARHIGPDPFTVTADELTGYLAGAELARETLRQRRNVLAGFYRWALEAGHIATDPAARLPRIASMPGLPRPIPEPPLLAALDAADESQSLILRLAAEAGLRRAEIARVHSEDLMHTLDGYALLVHGKGERERLVPIPGDLADALIRRGAGYMFPTRTGGHADPRRIARAVRPLLPEAYTLHTLRHRFATAAYRLSRDLFAVQTLLGHASPATTQRYVGLDTENLRSVVDAVAALRAPSP